ncbi:hypothetical protein SESBI_13986 [Sesbania bispinosa]|nr:hypothetical protein SESBI_13986 [Sesbania bispinosa]
MMEPFKARYPRDRFGASLCLRRSAIIFLTNSIDSGGSGLVPVCHYLFNILSWSGVHELILMNELLVKPQSPVLNDPRVSREVENFTEAWEAIASSSAPQFFKHMASYVQQLKVDRSRFRTLIAVAQELERVNDSANSVEETSIAESNPTVKALVRIHLTAMAKNRVRNVKPRLTITQV